MNYCTKTQKLKFDPDALTRNYATFGVIGRYTGMNIGTEYVKSLAYDGYGRRNSVSNGTDTFGYSFVDNSDLIGTITGPNGITITNSYENHRNLLTAVENKYGTITISGYAYRYDAIGRRKDVVNIGTAFSQSNLFKWGYNDRSEVTSTQKYNSVTPDSPSDPVSSYDYALAYDNIGNRSSYNTSTGGTAMTYTVNSLNQYTATANPAQTIAYDDDGNMTSMPQSSALWTLSWNAENQLIKMEKSDAKLEFVYDYLGRRVGKKVYSGSSNNWTLSKHLKFVYDGFKCIEELDGENSDAVLRKYLWNGERLLAVTDTTAFATYYYFADANKNIGQLIDNSGNIKAQYEYSPFGVETFVSGTYTENPFHFSSEYFDSETNLVYYNYRYYSPELGRWLSRDPIGELGRKNLYIMVSNKVINRIDLLGLIDPDDYVDQMIVDAIIGKIIDNATEDQKFTGDYINQLIEIFKNCIPLILLRDTAFKKLNGVTCSLGGKNVLLPRMSDKEFNDFLQDPFHGYISKLSDKQLNRLLDVQISRLTPEQHQNWLDYMVKTLKE